MKLEARARLLQLEASEVSYEQYSRVIASISSDPHKIQAFDFHVPSALKKLWSDLKAVGQLLAEAGSIGWESVVKAFQERSVFRLLKGVGFSLAKLLKAVKKAASIPAQALFAAFDDLADTFGSSALMQKLDPHARVAKLDEVIHRHPVLTKLTGVAVAGFLIWSFLNSSSTGDADYDLDIVEAVLASLKGDYSLADMFASKQGLKDMSILLFGLATGGLGVTAYGAGRVAKLLHSLGSHSGDASNLLVALFYSAAKKLHMKIDYSAEPPELKATLIADPEDKAGRTQRWYNQLTGPEREAYRRKWPGTKFHDKTKLIIPAT